MPEEVLRVKDLTVEYYTSGKVLKAIRNVSLSLEKGKILGVVGESGSGKSTLGLAIMGLLPANARVTSGEIILGNEQVLSANKSTIEQVRGIGISMIFQEPLNSLNPVYKVGYQIAEAIWVRDSRKKGLKANHMNQRPINYNIERRPSKAEMIASAFFSRPKMDQEVKKEIIELLRSVRINDPENVINKYPHELSGGMRQRVMIATSLALRPDVLIADEPTTALDVTTQAKVLFLIRQLAEEYGTAVMLISHDLSVVSEVADHCQVMYLGEVVEHAPISALFSKPLHPYTIGLLGSIPTRYVDEDLMTPIPGSIPDPINPPSGCKFHTRCSFAMPVCSVEEPKQTAIENSVVSCHLYGKGKNERENP